jgi:hypothetical protein
MIIEIEIKAINPIKHPSNISSVVLNGLRQKNRLQLQSLVLRELPHLHPWPKTNN